MNVTAERKIALEKRAGTTLKCEEAAAWRIIRAQTVTQPLPDLRERWFQMAVEVRRDSPQASLPELATEQHVSSILTMKLVSGRLLTQHGFSRSCGPRANLGNMSQSWESPARLTPMLDLTGLKQTSCDAAWPRDLLTVDFRDWFAESAVPSEAGRANYGIVAVARGAWRSRAGCSCGWQGRQHWLSAIAVYDAHLHAASNECRPAVPLVFRS